MVGMKNQLLGLFSKFYKYLGGGEGDGQTVLSTHCLLQYLCHWREMDSECRKDAMPKIKLQWIVYFTATLKQKLIFYFYYEKRIPENLRAGKKKRCLKWYAKSPQTDINSNGKGQSTAPWQNKGSWKCGFTPSPMTTASRIDVQRTFKVVTQTRTGMCNSFGSLKWQVEMQHLSVPSSLDM